jgi:hypothetical protein
MKTIKFLAFIALFISFTSCSKDDDPISGNDTITFEGSFSRNFNVQGTTQRATYTISQDKINYDLAGGFAQTNYDTSKEYFSKDDNRWVGHRASNNSYYVIFFKNISENEITLYKKEVASLEEGKSEPVPAANNTENHGWNTYTKNLPISGRVENLHAPQVGFGDGSGPFTKFSFKTGAKTDSETDWDIAFRGRTIIVNGGAASGLTDEPTRNGDAAAYIASGTFDDIDSVNIDELKQDSTQGLAIPTGSGNGWYNYTGDPDHLIVPIAGKILVFKTRDGKYAKIEMLSYYEDSDTSNDPRYLTFKYAYQANEGVATF